MNEKEAMDYIEHIQEKLGSDYSLRDVKELARRVGHPEREIKAVHIAGTNGKGSVGNYISTILAISGYTVGHYVSPAVFDYYERIQRIDGPTCTYISKEELAETITLLRGHCEDMVAEGFSHPTAFEIETVMAFLLFKEWDVDIAVVECGLGGRLDATNILAGPLLTVFTSISLDHTKLLGSTVTDIAREKYGIIKEHALVISKKQAECETLIKEICSAKRAELILIENKCIVPKDFLPAQTTFFYKNEEYTLQQGGVFQSENAAIAIESARALVQKGFEEITEKAIKEGLLQSRWKGRFDVVSREPFLLVDGAHNENAAKSLCHSLEAYFPGEKFSFIIGVFRDKAYRKMLSLLFPIAENIYTVTAPGARGLPSGELYQCIIKEEGVTAYDCGRMEDALKLALAENRGGKIVVCGSLSILKEVYLFFGNLSRKSH